MSKKWEHATDEWCPKAKRYKIENFYPLDKCHKINDGQNKMKDTF